MEEVGLMFQFIDNKYQLFFSMLNILISDIWSEDHEHNIIIIITTMLDVCPATEADDAKFLPALQKYELL